LAAADAKASLTGKLKVERVTPEWQQQPWKKQPAEWWGAMRHPGELATLLWSGGLGRGWGSEQLAQRSFCSLEVSAGCATMQGELTRLWWLYMSSQTLHIR